MNSRHIKPTKNKLTFPVLAEFIDLRRPQSGFVVMFTAAQTGMVVRVDVDSDRDLGECDTCFISVSCPQTWRILDPSEEIALSNTND